MGARAAAALLLARGAVGEGACPREAPDDPRGFSGGWPQELDVAVYWYGAGGRRERATGASTRYYDSSRSTLIYVHGWEGGHGGTTERCHRASPTCHVGLCPEGEDLAAPWIRRGWNVGYFYWDQFADEPCPRDAEHKIWRNSDQMEGGMRWLGYGESGEILAHFYQAAGYSVAELCADAIATAMPAPGAGTEVRLVGHSIGAQLVARCADLLHRQGTPSAPKRLALLEPYFTLHVWFPFRCDSTNMTDGFGRTVAANTAALVRRLARTHSVVTEVWKSSMLTENQAFGVPNSALEDEGVYVEVLPTWCGTPAIEYLECRHGAVYPTYFHGGAVEASPESACPVPMPTCPTYLMPHFVGSRWSQTSGQDTYDTDDDSFAFGGRRSNASNESYFDIPKRDGSPFSWLSVLGAALLVCVSVALVCCGYALCRARSGTKRYEKTRALQSFEASRDGDMVREVNGVCYAGEDPQYGGQPLLSSCAGHGAGDTAFHLCGGQSDEESDEEESVQHLVTVAPVERGAPLAGALPSSRGERRQPGELPVEEVRAQPPLNLLSGTPPTSFQSAQELHATTSLQASMAYGSPRPASPRLLETSRSRGPAVP